MPIIRIRDLARLYGNVLPGSIRGKVRNKRWRLLDWNGWRFFDAIAEAQRQRWEREEHGRPEREAISGSRMLIEAKSLNIAADA
jgi:hypothetical protein